MKIWEFQSRHTERFFRWCQPFHDDKYRFPPLLPTPVQKRSDDINDVWGTVAVLRISLRTPVNRTSINIVLKVSESAMADVFAIVVVRAGHVNPRVNYVGMKYCVIP